MSESLILADVICARSGTVTLTDGASTITLPLADLELALVEPPPQARAWADLTFSFSVPIVRWRQVSDVQWDGRSPRSHVAEVDRLNREVARRARLGRTVVHRIGPRGARKLRGGRRG